MKTPKIQTVCGFGCGSSFMLKLKVQDILKEHSLEGEVFCSDVGTCCANDCDVIFISKELAERIEERTQVPIVIINNFMDKTEIEEKTLQYFKTLNK